MTTPAILRKRLTVTFGSVLVVLAASLITALPAAAATGTISGVAFQDGNRNGAFDAGESAMADQQLYLFDGSRQTYFGTTVTGADGRYSFSGLADGAYSVEYAAGSWQPLKYSSVPTTTGSIYPRVAVQLAGQATASFGWRPITRSTTAGSPISAFAGPSGLRVESYTDAVSAAELHTALAATLLGAEAPTVTVRFDLGNTNSTSAAIQESGGRFTAYSALSYVTYGSWLEGGDQTLVHEYGHAWSLYFAHMVQQDSTLAGYISARGLTGDARLNSSYTWSVREMIAEDYRQLFGSANAAARPQANADIARAADVPGLRPYLQDTFRTAPASSSDPTPAPAPEPASLAISGLGVSPQPVVKSGTVAFGLSQPATVSVRILASNGSLVRTLLASASKGAGTVQVVWDRKTSAGRRAAAGSYQVVVDASTSSSTSSAAATFTVS